MKPYIEEYKWFDNNEGKTRTSWYVQKAKEPEWWRKLLRKPLVYERVEEWHPKGAYLVDKKFIDKQKAQIWIDNWCEHYKIPNRSVYYVPMDPVEIVRWKKHNKK